jgi:hypothetical protein
LPRHFPNLFAVAIGQNQLPACVAAAFQVDKHAVLRGGEEAANDGLVLVNGIGKRNRIAGQLQTLRIEGSAPMRKTPNRIAARIPTTPNVA